VVSEDWVDRWAESEGKGGVWVYEAYEVKNKREKLRCLLLSLEKEKYFFNIYDVITSPEKEKSSANHYTHTQTHTHTYTHVHTCTHSHIPVLPA
jgi:hypothetical protein